MDEKTIVKDSNGNALAEGDSVLLTKDLKVKGFNKDLKRGTLIKNIRLTSNPGEVEGKVDGSILVLKTMFLKKK
jgi:protein PhnA